MGGRAGGNLSRPASACIPWSADSWCKRCPLGCWLSTDSRCRLLTSRRGLGGTSSPPVPAGKVAVLTPAPCRPAPALARAGRRAAPRWWCPEQPFALLRIRTRTRGSRTRCRRGSGLQAASRAPAAASLAAQAAAPRSVYMQLMSRNCPRTNMLNHLCNGNLCRVFPLNGAGQQVAAQPGPPASSPPLPLSLLPAGRTETVTCAS